VGGGGIQVVVSSSSIAFSQIPTISLLPASLSVSNQAFPRRCRKLMVLPELTTLFLSLGSTY
jgi:hypothetical protein